MITGEIKIHEEPQPHTYNSGTYKMRPTTTMERLIDMEEELEFLKEKDVRVGDIIIGKATGLRLLVERFREVKDDDSDYVQWCLGSPCMMVCKNLSAGNMVYYSSAEIDWDKHEKVGVREATNEENNANNSTN